MREILFRGKRVDNGEWIYGSLITMDEEMSQVFIFPHFKGASSLSCGQIVSSGMMPIDPETVGQYTGLTDKNGVKIFEGDKVIVDMKYFDIKRDEGKVIFSNGCFGVQFGCTTDYFKTISVWDAIEVIGNIHDNNL